MFKIYKIYPVKWFKCLSHEYKTNIWPNPIKPEHFGLLTSEGGKKPYLAVGSRERKRKRTGAGGICIKKDNQSQLS